MEKLQNDSYRLQSDTEKLKDSLDQKVDSDTFFAEINSLKDLLNQLMNKDGELPKVDLNAGNSALKLQIEKLLDRIKELEKWVEMNEGDIGRHNNQIEEIFDLLSKKADKDELQKLKDELSSLLKQIKDMKDTLNRYKDKLDKPDLSELLQKHLNDLEKKFNEFV